MNFPLRRGLRILPLLLTLAAGLIARCAAAPAPALPNPFVFSDPGKLPAEALPSGAAVAFDGDLLLVAGGRLADGRLSDQAAAYRQTSRGHWQRIAEAALPSPFADGAVAVTERGLVVAGGWAAENRASAQVWKIEFEVATQRLGVEPLPDLPAARAEAGALIFRHRLYVAGGRTAAGQAHPESNFWSLDLTHLSAGSRWTVLPGWEGGGLDQPLLVAQNSGDGDSLYLLAGRDDGGPSRRLNEFRTDRGRWLKRPASPAQLSSAGAFAVGSGHIFALHAGTTPAAPLTFLAYHTVTGTWTESERITGTGVPFALRGLPNGVILVARDPSGAVSFSTGRFPAYQSTMRPADYLILGAYFCVIFFLAWFFSRKEHTTDDYFRAGKRVPGWAAGISILATRFSAISFLTYPAKSFATNWTYFLHQFVYPLTVFIVIKYVVSFFVRLNVTTAYEYLDQRFGATIRLIGSLKFVGFELLRMGLLILIPAMILSVIIGVDLNVCIILIGVIATIYTCLGGIEGVIWIEVLQFGIILSGTLLAIAVALHGTPGGLIDIYHSAADQGKTQLLDFSWNFTAATVWVFLLDLPGAANESVSAQYVVQRFISVKDLRQAAHSMFINCLAGPFLISLFFLLGTAIFVYYQANPAALNPAMIKQDEVMAWFIARQLPTGIAGLMIAAILASTMSSLESSLSSTISVAITDLYRPRSGGASDRQALKKAKHFTMIAGLFGTVSALVLAAFQIRSLLDYVLQVAFLAGGGLAGIFYLGMFTTRAHTKGVLIGFITSAACLTLLVIYTSISLFAYNGIGVIICVAVGYTASVLLPAPPRALPGLTIHTLPKQP